MLRAHLTPCLLLSQNDIDALGMTSASAAIRVAQAGGIQACTYRSSIAEVESANVVTAILSQTVPDRAMQFRALQEKAKNEVTLAQQQERGEYFGIDGMCKVSDPTHNPTIQCLGASNSSVVALTVTGQQPAITITYPALYLKIISDLVGRLHAAGD